MPIPSLRLHRGRHQLSVGGEPFLVLGAELHNSSGSHTAALRRGLDRVKEIGANTALVPISWELVEPVEGSFSFDLVHDLLELARERELRVIPLWFGSWKNGQSTYAPGWVKTDPARFPRAVAADGRLLDVLSPFAESTRAADAAAFAELMAYFAQYDADEHTVLLVQVENEVGVLTSDRDHSAGAEQAFASAVPAELTALLHSDAGLAARAAWEDNGRPESGTWSTMLGDTPQAHEAFMAWGFAAFVEAVAAAGAARHPLPLIANAWLNSDADIEGATLAGGQMPGTYPSGGPVPGVAAIWRVFAPTLSAVVPDIYLGDFDAICARYRESNDGILFIPEMRRDGVGAADMFVATGEHHAIGVSPFGVDSGSVEVLSELRDAYGLLTAIAPLITSAEPAALAGFHLRDSESAARIRVGSRSFDLTRARALPDTETTSQCYGLVVEIADNEFVAAGRGFILTPVAHDGERVAILEVDELGPALDPLRRLNGDETLAGSAWTHPCRGETPAGTLPIAAEGENSGLSRCRLYSF